MSEDPKAYTEETAPFEDEVFDETVQDDDIPQPEFPVLLQNDYNLGDVKRAIVNLFVEYGGGRDDESILEGRRIFAQKADQAGTIEHSLSLLENYYSAEADRALDYLRKHPELVEDPKFSRRLVEDGAARSTLGPVGIQPKKITGDELIGNEAIAAFEATRTGGMTNVMLYNSGFSVSLRQPTLAEIYILVNRCRALYNEYGGILGAAYYLLDDYLIKKQIMEFVRPLIMETSVKNWRNTDVLFKVFSLNDLQHLLMEIAIMMYPKGFDQFLTVCPPSVEGQPKTGCGHTQKHEIDLRVLVKTMFSRMSPESIRFMAQTRDTGRKKNTVEEILAYQEGLGLDKTVTAGDRIFYLSPPTLKQYFDSSEQIYADTLADMQAVAQEARAGVVSSRTFRFYLPWVTKMVQLGQSKQQDEDPPIAGTTSDRGPLAYFLDRLMDDQTVANQVGEAIADIIDNSALTLICYKAEKCPKCGYMPKDNAGFVTVDPRSTFFTLGEAKSPEVY